MPLPRFTKLDAAKQQHILAAARDEFARHGFAEASLNRIITTAGISKGAMYYYFADKGDLHATVMHGALDSVAAAVSGVPKPIDAEGVWQWGMVAFGALSSVLADETLGALARDLYAGGHSLAYRELHQRVTEWTRSGVALGQQLGAVRDDVPQDLLVQSTTGLLVAIDRWFAQAMADKPFTDMLPLVDGSLRLVRDLLEKRAPTSAPAESIA